MASIYIHHKEVLGIIQWCTSGKVFAALSTEIADAKGL